MSAEDTPQPIAAIHSYDDLRAALKARREQLGLSQLAVDHIAGTHDAYYGKIEVGVRHFGDMSLGAVLGALQIELVIRPRDPRAQPL